MTDGSSSARRTQRAAFVSTSVDHPHLERLDSESIRIFLRRYDDYCKEVTARAEQLLASSTVTTEPIRPVSLTFCIDSEQIQSALDLGFIEGVEEYEKTWTIRNYGTTSTRRLKSLTRHSQSRL